MARKTEHFERPILTVDVVMFTLIDNKLHVLLPKREKGSGRDVFIGVPCLVGSYIRTQEDQDTHAAAKRAVAQKTGITPPYLEQLAMFSGPDRDPDGWSATMAYVSMIKVESIAPSLVAGILRDFHPVDMLPQEIGFDHRDIVYWAVQRVRNKASYSTLPLYLMPPHFTLHALYKTYEALMGQTMDYITFRRKIKDLEIIEPTGHMSDPKETRTRSAELYRARDRKLWLFNEGIAA